MDHFLTKIINFKKDKKLDNYIKYFEDYFLSDAVIDEKFFLFRHYIELDIHYVNVFYLIKSVY